MATVTWSYNGSNQMQATITGAIPGEFYRLHCSDANSSDDLNAATGTTYTLTVTDVGGLSAGDQFRVSVMRYSTNDFLGANVFKYGTAGSVGVGYPVTWSYDGAGSVTAAFTTGVSDTYNLKVDSFNSGWGLEDVGVTFSDGPGALSHTRTIHTPDAGIGFIAWIQDQFGPNDLTIAVRVFSGQVASAGVAGSPATGGTDTGDTSGRVDPDPDAGGVGGVRIGLAFDSTTLDPTPTWTYITETDSLVASYEITRGRQYEFDKTDTGTAKITINDRDGVLDPTNTTGPYFGLIEPLVQVQIELWNPVASEWSSRFRGFVEGYDYVVAPFTRQNTGGDTVGNTRLEISCVDLFAILTAIEMQPDGTFGDAPPTTPVDVTGNIFFDNAAAQDRITQVLGNAAIDTAFFVVFTLNVNLQETVYSPSQNVLEVIQDAVDAEFPTVSNAYCDRFGRFAVHGRLAKFDPAGVSAGAGPDAWDFHEWKVGDGKAIAASPSDTAQIRTFAFNRGWDKVFNYALCTPKDIPAADIAAQVSQDAVSIAKFGFRSWSAESLIIGALTGDPLTNTPAGTLTGLNALDETKLYADFVVANYASPRNRITDITIKSLRPDDSRATTTWDLLCNIDISDLVAAYVSGPGDAPTEYIFNGDEFFVEGIRETATPLVPEYAMVTTTLDLSPRGYFTAGAWSGA